MDEDFKLVTDQVKHLLERVSKPALQEIFRSHLEILNADAGTNEEKLRELCQYTSDKLHELRNLDPEQEHESLSKEDRLAAMAAHITVLEFVGDILRDAWGRSVKASAKKKS